MLGQRRLHVQQSLQISYCLVLCFLQRHCINNLGAILAMKVIYAMEEVNNSANEDRYNWRPKQRTIKQISSRNSSSVHCCLRYFNSLVTSRWVHTAIIFCHLQLLLLRLYKIWLNFHKMSQDWQLYPIPNIFIPRTPKYYNLLHSIFSM